VRKKILKEKCDKDRLARWEFVLHALKTMCFKHQITQAKLAVYAMVHHTQMNRIINRKTPPTEWLLSKLEYVLTVLEKEFK